MGRPEIDARTESDTEDVGAGPVDEVEIKVVDQFWGIEDSVGCFADIAKLATGAFEEGAGFLADGRHGIGFVSRSV